MFSSRRPSINSSKVALGKLGSNPLLGGLAAASEESGEDFRRALGLRNNRYRAEERTRLDAMKRANPERWQTAFEAALEKAIADARANTIAFWTGDPDLFEEEGELADEPKVG
jgi:hypothetical protein